MLATAFAWLVGVNAWTAMRFWQDKARAVTRRRRIPEFELLWLAAIGGSPGAFFARHQFRHKTRKEPFSTLLMVIAAVQAGSLGGWLFL